MSTFFGVMACGFVVGLLSGFMTGFLIAAAVSAYLDTKPIQPNRTMQ